MTQKQIKDSRQFGDFQTPDGLAIAANQLLTQLDWEPQSVVEPTCGRGAFLVAALRAFPAVKKAIGLDINKAYLDSIRERLRIEQPSQSVSLLHADFFSLDWLGLLQDLPEPILVIGNPPWVTSSELGTLGSSNLPEKTNFQRRRGLDAITGKSNFDISEWMILQYIRWLKGRRGYIAVLCKTAVARKVLTHAWKHSEALNSARVYLIDAMKYFGASVDACFFVVEVGKTKSQDCYVYSNLSDLQPSGHIGYNDAVVVSDVEKYGKWRHLRGADPVYIWRSGIKHDCAKVLELDETATGLQNGYEEALNIENTLLFPLYKSSDIGNGDDRKRRKYLLVTQHLIGEETAHIKKDAPKTWRYLQRHEGAFSKRKSSIYRDRPQFSIFGVGEYTFSPWKVAISGFYKTLRFKCVGPVGERPSVFDDTVYFLPCWSRAEARFLTDVLSSQPAQEFLRSMIFWSNKRPVTAELLRRLDIKALCTELGRESEYQRYAKQRDALRVELNAGQLTLGIAERQARYKRA